MSNKKIVVMPKSEYDRLESAWQDVELRAEKAEARVKELEQRLANEVKVNCELNRELILQRLEK
jgi:PHD/YefM family antitoxin component YafN of YafNO toxin-antitoxin module